ncbi:MAG: diphosphomevalonate decarboxylase, partial [Nannocystaceae bacterium]
MTVALPTSVSAVAHSNIALVKYWGKRAGTSPGLNLPAVGSLSMTLSDLRTQTRVRPGAENDRFALDGKALTGPFATKVFDHLDRIWRSKHTGERPRCDVESVNHLPTSAGLASSASGFAALTLAAAAAFRLPLDLPALSRLARQGSGSAARSLWGGFVRLARGQRSDGLDCHARPLFPASHWDTRLLIVHTAKGPKSVSSRAGMEQSRLTSPYYPPWVATSEEDLDAAEQALRERDIQTLGTIMEHSCFKMHACMMATQPPLVYWNGTTLDVFHALWAARAQGLAGYGTSDAGPHVKVFCLPHTAAPLREKLAEVPGVHKIDIVKPGPDASVEVT